MLSVRPMPGIAGNHAFANPSFCGRPESMASNRTWDVGEFGKNSLLKKFFRNCTILNSIPPAQSIRCVLDGETERY